MKHLYALMIAFILFFSCSDDNSTQPQKLKKFFLNAEIEVGSQPAEIFYDENTGIYHIFCLGKDINYNGVKDENDENPSWWVLNQSNLSSPVKKIDFDFGNMGFPFRPFVDFTNKKLYISQNNFLKIYDLNTSDLINQFEIPYNATAISVEGNYLYLSIVKSFDQVGELESYDLNTFKKTGSVTCGYSVGQSIIYTLNNNKYIAVISQGNGAENSILDIFLINNGSFTQIKRFENLGNFANHIAIYNDELYLTINGSHKIYVIDLKDHTVKNIINTLTNGYNGPREIALLDEKYLFTTTYDKKILIFDKNNGSLLDSYLINNKTEGLAFGANGNQLLVAEINDENYVPINKVAVYKVENN